MALVAFLVMFAMLVSLCVYEETGSGESSRSRICDSLLSLTLAVAASSLRILVRCLKCFKTRVPDRINTIYQKVCAYSESISLQTNQEVWRMSRLEESQKSLVRTQTQNTQLLRGQIELLRAKSELSSLRRRNVDLDMRLHDIEHQREQLATAIALKTEENAKLFLQATNEKRRLDDALSKERERANLPRQQLSRAQERIEELYYQLHRANDTQTEAIQMIEKLDYARKRLYKDIDKAQAKVDAKKKQMVKMHLHFGQLQSGFKTLCSQRLQVIRMLTFAVVFLVFCHRRLGSTLASTFLSRASVQRQWRIVSSQKIESQRALAKTLNANCDLRNELESEKRLREEAKKLAAKWKNACMKSIRARQLASKKFTKVLQATLARQFSTTTNLLTGLLFLWRLNLALSQQLAEVRGALRAIEEAGASQPVHSAEEVPVQPTGGGVLVSCKSVAVSGYTSAEPISRAPLQVQNLAEPVTPILVNVVVSTSTSQVKETRSCSVDTSDLQSETTEIGIMTEPDVEQLHLCERVMRLQRKFAAMETLDAVYRRTLLHKTLPDPSKGSKPSGNTSINATPSPSRSHRQPFFAPPTKAKASHIFSQPLDRLPFPILSYSRSSSSPSTPTRGSPAPNQPFLLNVGNVSFS